MESNARSWLTTREVSTAFGKSERTVRLLCQSGAIRGARQMRRRGEWRIPGEFLSGNDGNHPIASEPEVWDSEDMIKISTPKDFVRIDGTDYERGSEAYFAAQRARERRDSAAYLEFRKLDYERNRRILGAMESRFDANQTAFLARDLIFVRRDIEKYVYAELRAARYVPVDTNAVPRGANAYETRTMNFRGEALIGANLEADDAPQVDVAMDSDMATLINITASYSYNVQELEHAAFTGTPLPRDKAMACAEVIARGLDKVGRVGLPSMGVFGLFNNPNVPVLTLTNGEWLTATADEILADLNQIEEALIANSSDLHRAETLILPTAYERRLRTLRMDTANEQTVAQYFLANAAMVTRIDRWSALDTATGADIAVGDAPQGMLITSSSDVLFWPVPIVYEELPPEPRNFKWLVNARARCGGVDIRRPMGCLYIENLD